METSSQVLLDWRGTARRHGAPATNQGYWKDRISRKTCRSPWRRRLLSLPISSKGSPVCSNVGEPAFWVVSAASATDGASAVDPAASPCTGVGAFLTDSWAISVSGRSAWGGVAITTLIAGKEIAMMHGHLVVPGSLIVVVDNPPFLASTQVKNIPLLGHLSPMTSSKELIAGVKTANTTVRVHSCSSESARMKCLVTGSWSELTSSMAEWTLWKITVSGFLPG